MKQLTCQTCAFFEPDVREPKIGICRVTSPIQAVCRSCFKVSQQINGVLYECPKCGAPNRADPCGKVHFMKYACGQYAKRAAVADLFKSGPNAAAAPNPLPSPPRPAGDIPSASAHGEGTGRGLAGGVLR